jgi:hypothetical protein
MGDEPKDRKDEPWRSEKDTIEKRDREGPAEEARGGTSQEPGIGSTESENGRKDPAPPG